MEKVWQLSNLYVATLRQMYLIHQHSHWTSRGKPFYGDHLLFQRLYESAAEDADTAAEKMIGLFGTDGVDYKEQCKLMNKIAMKFSELYDEPLEISLAIEKAFLDFSQAAYKAFDEEGVLSLGLDDMIMAIASNRETSVYLLKQALTE